MKSILITGASAGIGRATARRFLAEGWYVGLMARRRDALEDVAEGFENAVTLPGDVVSEANVDAAVSAFLERAGRFDVLFNNAGMFGPASLIDEIGLDEWRTVVDVNLNGMFLMARAAFRAMRAQAPQGGRIINNGSISAHAPRDRSIAYTTTKHAITGMTKSLSLDGRAFDIACGQIDIGNARTELLEGLIRRNPENPPPVMDVSHVADAVFQMSTLPPEANVQFMTMMATKMPFIGRG
ncbi:SDR family oxidoreductase [Aquicoccus sp.]|uniref:SDR family oxidoreductase n=1 Tax=Aquicoccus sp. TaxID=2055851 RepID=UPI0035680B75